MVSLVVKIVVRRIQELYIYIMTAPTACVFIIPGNV